MSNHLNQCLWPSISGYSLTEELYVGNRTAVYRALADAEGQACPVVIKVLKSPHPSFKALVRFRNQYIIAKNLPIEGIISPLTLDPWGHSYALVMEDVGGIALSEYLQSCGPLSVREVLESALQMADILHGLSQHRVLHKDIKPANILIHPDTHKIWLTDFSLASLLPKEVQAPQNPSALEGTLAYISPEQTGRMNRGIDYRVDFYGLGVTLYELLTGMLPFQSDDTLALIHCHLAKTPVLPDAVCREGSPSQPIPKGLSDIVLKLMAKNAENRYQSALGLKHDLQTCLSQWEACGQIQAFELGQADRCDRFLIPEKLYGRATEVESLLDAFERVSQGSSEFMLVAGFSGIGKTAVVNEVHKPITREKGYFIKGKFDQFHQNIPLSAFVQAFRSLMGQLLGGSDVEVANWKAKILTAVGESGQVLIEVIPELEHLIGKQPAVTELSGTASQDRFNLLFGRFIQLFTTPAHPLAIFLDDLQWADSASLTLLKLLMDESKAGYLLVLGAYRDNEVFPAHPLMLTLNDLQQQNASVHTLVLDPLLQTDINQLVADTLRCTSAIAEPLSELVYQKTQGNPFFTAQLLYGLYSDGHIHFESADGSWQCDLTQLKQLALTNDVVAFMVEQLKKLPRKTQDILKLASCIGNCFDLDALSMICDRSRLEIAAELWHVLYEGLILPENEVYKFFQGTHRNPKKAAEISASYRFLHDRVQQAAYYLMDQEARSSTHLHIGRSLLTHLSPTDIEDRLFDIVNHWNIAQGSLVEADAKKHLCKLNLRAGRKATVVIAYDMAEHYAATAIGLLPSDSWQTDYDLTLESHTLSIKAAYLNGHFDQVNHRTATLVAQAKNLLDTIDAYEIKILATVAQKRAVEAIHLGLKVLEKLEIPIPAEPNSQEIQQALADMENLVPKDKINSLVSLPAMTEPRALSALQILNCIAISVYLAKPQLFPLIVLAQVKLSILFGNSPISAGAYARYSLLLCGKVNDIETGYAFGQLALALADQYNNPEIKTRVLLMVGALTLPWKQHLRDGIPLLKQAYQEGIDSGNLEPAALSHYYESQSAYLIGVELQALEAQIRSYSGHINQVKQTLHFHNSELVRQVIGNLMGHAKNPCALAGAAFDEAVMLPQFQASQNLLGLFCVHLHKLMLCYWFEQIDAAVKHSQEAVNYLSGVTAQATVPVFYFYASLACLSDCASHKAAMNGESLQEYPLWDWTQASVEKLRHWAELCSMNFQHRLELVEAEQYAIAGNKLEAIEAYDRAIAGAKANQYIQEEALANELAAKFYLNWGKERVAAGYLQEAYDCYTQWGAKAKTDDLEKRYPQLLQPGLQQIEQSSYSLDSLSSVAPPTISVHSSSSSAKASTRDINQILDLSAILKGAQTLSEIIDLETLLEKLAQMMLQTSGAEQLALLLPNELGAWQVRVTATPDAVTLTSTMLSSHTDLPVQLIQYVQHTQEILAVDGQSSDLPIVDPYLQQQQPRSVLCLPLLHQHELKGLLYLQHQSMAGGFHRDRITVLNFLCTQAAIALANAQLYQISQTTAQQLEASLGQLQRSETRFRNLAANVPGVIFQVATTLDGTSSILYISPDCDGLFEVSAEVMKARHPSLRDFEYPEDRSAIDQLLEKIKQTLEPFDHEFRIVTPSGRVKWVHAIARLYKQSDGAIRCDGVVMDISDRKRTEAALQLSEARATAAFNQAAAGIFEVNLETGQLMRVNQFFAQMSGYTVSELLQLTVPEVTHPDYLATISHQLKRLQAGDLEYFTIEKRLVRKDGSTCWVSSTVSRMQLPGESVQRSLVVVLDIRARKAIERQLEFTQYGLDHAADSFYCLDEEAHIVQVNKATCQRTGYTREQLLKMTIHELAPTCPKETTWKPHWDKLKRLKSYSFESVHRARTGEIFPVEVVCNYLEFDGKAYDFELVRDITARKQAETALHLSEARATATFRQAPVGFAEVALSPHNQLSRVNPCFCQMLGYTNAELVGMTVRDITHPDDIALGQEPSKRLSRGELSSFTIEKRYLRKDGTDFWAETTVYLIRQQNGEALCEVAFVQDISEKKRLELQRQEAIMALQLSEARANATFDQAVVGMAESNLTDGKIIRPNSYGCQMLGYTEQELETLTVADVTHPDDVSDSLTQLKRLLSGEVDSFIVEKRYIRKDKSWFWAITTVSLIQSSEEEAPRCLAIMQDISDRKAAEQKLLESQSFLQTVLDTFPLSIFWKDRDSRYIGVNQNFAQDAGFKNSEDIAGLTDSDMPWAESEGHLYQADDQEVMASDSPKIGILETQIQADGTQVWIETNKLPLHDLDGNVIGVMGTYQDISDRKQAEMALEQEGLRRSAIFNASPDGIHILDAAGNLIESNEGFAKMLGYSFDEVSQMNVADWDAKWSKSELQERCSTNFGSTQAMLFETLHRRKDGSVFPVEISACSMQWNGEFALVAISRDISERKLAEAKLKRTNQELARATRMKDEFLANMSHELRTPLNAILGMTEGLQDEVFGQINAQQLKSLTTIEQSGAHLLELINEVLDLAKIEAGNIELTYSSVAVTHLCQSSLAFVKQQSLEKGVQLHLNTPWDLPSIRVDERRIRQVLINLLNNAVKFTPSGGNVTLKVELSSPDESHRQPYLRFAVTDTGIGISPDELNHLFQPFVQIDSALNRQYEGTGLGLALVKRITELHGGRVTVTSNVGTGSCFAIELPHDATTLDTSMSQNPST